MTPIEAARKEADAQWDALARMVGDGPLPDRVTITVEFDQQRRMPRAVELDPHWRRHILGGAVAPSTKRCDPSLRSAAPLTR